MEKTKMQKSTEYLDNKLNNSSLKDFEALKKELPSQKELTFTEYFNRYISEHNLVLSDIVKASQISKNYVYQIINGKRNPSKDHVIALCVSAGMSVEETNRALKISNVGIFYSKDVRDTAIVLCIKEKMNVIEINDFLYEKELPILQTSSEAKTPNKK